MDFYDMEVDHDGIGSVCSRVCRDYFDAERQANDELDITDFLGARVD